VPPIIDVPGYLPVYPVPPIIDVPGYQPVYPVQPIYPGDPGDPPLPVIPPSGLAQNIVVGYWDMDGASEGIGASTMSTSRAGAAANKRLSDVSPDFDVVTVCYLPLRPNTRFFSAELAEDIQILHERGQKVVLSVITGSAFLFNNQSVNWTDFAEYLISAIETMDFDGIDLALTDSFVPSVPTPDEDIDEGSGGSGDLILLRRRALSRGTRDIGEFPVLPGAPDPNAPIDSEPSEPEVPTAPDVPESVLLDFADAITYVVSYFRGSYKPYFILSFSPFFSDVQGQSLEAVNVWDQTVLNLIDVMRGELSYVAVRYYDTAVSCDFPFMVSENDPCGTNEMSVGTFVDLSLMLIEGFDLADGTHFEGLAPDQVVMVGLSQLASDAFARGALTNEEYAAALTEMLGLYPDFRGIGIWTANLQSKIAEGGMNQFVEDMRDVIDSDIAIDPITPSPLRGTRARVTRTASRSRRTRVATRTRSASRARATVSRARTTRARTTRTRVTASRARATSASRYTTARTVYGRGASRTAARSTATRTRLSRTASALRGGSRSRVAAQSYSASSRSRSLNRRATAARTTSRSRLAMQSGAYTTRSAAVRTTTAYGRSARTRTRTRRGFR
jgi:chitinase